MEASDVVAVAHEAIIVMLTMAAPIMLVALVVGLVIALFQALTQIQEMTLTFVPKILVICVSLLLFLPFMLGTLTGFAERLSDRMVALG